MARATRSREPSRFLRRLQRGAFVFARGWRRYVVARAAFLWDRLYRICYITGIQSIRLARRLHRRVRALLAPVGRVLYRVADRLLLVYLRRVRAEMVRIRGGFVLAARQTREAFQTGWRAGFRFLLSLPVVAVRRHRKALALACNILLPTAAAIALLITVQYWSSLTFALELEYQGQPIGYIADETVYSAAAELVEGRVVNTGTSFVMERSPKMTVTVVPKAEILDESSLCDRLMDAMSDSITAGAGLYVNDAFVGAAEDTLRLNEIVTDTLNHQRDGSGEDFASFVDDVRVCEGLYPTDSFIPLETLRAYIERLDVQVTRLIVYDEEIPFAKETKEDTKKYLGYSSVRTKGVKGVCRNTAQVVFLNGEEISRTQLTSTVIQDPVTQVTVIGAMKYNPNTKKGDGKATGRFIWPVPYTKRITSYYGTRNGSLHAGVDISAPGVSGQAILAADGGTVVKVNGNGSWGSGWGNYVLIDHGNGYQTRYAHCKSVCVKVGQKVAQGELIAYVGNTGNSSGAHLHFEIYLNGTRVNPLPYLQKAS